MDQLCIMLLSGFYLFIGFVGLLSKRMKAGYYLFLLLHCTITSSIIGPFWGQGVTFVLVLISAIVIYFGCNRNLLDVILSLLGYLVAILVNHLCSVPLSLLGISLHEVQTYYPIPFLIAVTCITFILFFPINKYFIQPKLYFLQSAPVLIHRLFLLELFLGIVLITANFVYGERYQYPTNVLAFNGAMIAAFTLCTMILFFSLYQIFQKNHELTMREKELDIMREYMENMEKFYDDLRIYRHDSRNILATLQSYIDSDDNTRLRTYFYEKILPSQTPLSHNGFTLGKLHHMKVTPVKSILYSKIITALNKGLNLTLELEEPIEEIPMDILDLCQILGILLDNSIEAACSSPEKILMITIASTSKNIVFILTNSTLPITVPISRLLEKKFTTKEGHDGLGLYTVSQITNALDNVTYSFDAGRMFRQIIEIRKDN